VDRKDMDNLDPELVRQLETEPSVQAVLRLRSPRPGRLAPAPEETEALARQALSRVQGELRCQPRAFTIFRHLGYFVVDAEPAFLLRLLEQEEIASASANVRPPQARAVGSGSSRA
jgi:hypothetical protein